jgi:flagellar protein FliO/FliZ
VKRIGSHCISGLLRTGAVAALLVVQPVAAAVGQKANGILNTQYLLQVTGSLLLVLAAVFVLALVLKRFNAVPGGTGKTIQVLASTRLGGREKLMLVRVANQLLVLGVAPGNLRTLHTFPVDEELEASAAADGSFSALLQAANRGEGKS